MLAFDATPLPELTLRASVPYTPPMLALRPELFDFGTWIVGLVALSVLLGAAWWGTRWLRRRRSVRPSPPVLGRRVGFETAATAAARAGATAGQVPATFVPAIGVAVAPVGRTAADAVSTSATPASTAVATPAVATPVDGLAGQRLPSAATQHAWRRGLARTQDGLLGRITQLLRGRTALDAGLLDDIEALLLTADVGVDMVMALMDGLRGQHQREGLADADAVFAALRARMRAAFDAAALASPPGGDVLAPVPAAASPLRPQVVLFVGVNGVGKTTTIGKLAARLGREGRRVVLAAGDTFRAAAAEQLAVWATRAGARMVRGEAGADPASVMFNAVASAQTGGDDVVLADTAGRLHTRAELMDEIKKVRRAIGRVREGAPDATWLVVDATTGQNALQQATEFHRAVGLTGIVLTKLDGTAKGGIAVAIVEALRVPVVWVGTGEGADDLVPFSAEQFLEALFVPAQPQANSQPGTEAAGRHAGAGAPVAHMGLAASAPTAKAPAADEPRQ